MTEIQIAWLELIMCGGIGVILALSGVIIDIVAKRKNKACTKQVEGIVIRHRFLGEGKMYPIVEYFVDETCYKTRKRFRGVKTLKISGFPAIPMQPNAYEDEKGWLHVKRGSFVNMRNLAEQLWPIGSKMTVYYNPNNPKTSYVERPITKSFTSIMFVIMGIAVVLLSVALFFLIQL